jgi:intracellular sulfur oxidation DsrE/DsrF family protein
MNPKILFSLIPAFFMLITLQAQQGERTMGPVIKDFGPTFKIDNPDFKTDPNKEYKVVFDIHNSPEDPSAVNPMINTLARFLNMHAGAGVPLKNLKVVGVIHNKASKDAMNNEAYREKFGVDNPNIPLMEALEKAGAEFYMCGQSIYARGVDLERMAGPVKTALSAMTVFLSLQSEGYTLIRF